MRCAAWILVPVVGGLIACAEASGPATDKAVTIEMDSAGWVRSAPGSDWVDLGRRSLWGDRTVDGSCRIRDSVTFAPGESVRIEQQVAINLRSCEVVMSRGISTDPRSQLSVAAARAATSPAGQDEAALLMGVGPRQLLMFSDIIGSPRITDDNQVQFPPLCSSTHGMIWPTLVWVRLWYGSTPAGCGATTYAHYQSAGSTYCTGTSFADFNINRVIATVPPTFVADAVVTPNCALHLVTVRTNN